MVRLDVTGLSDDPLSAAAAFHASWLPRARALGQEDLVLVFAPADHRHRGWRLAVIQDLARAAVPARVNGIAAADGAAIEETLRYLKAAPGVTGQYLVLDDGEPSL